MPNTSATGGYLAPTSSPAPLEGQALLNFLQQIWVNITGLPGTSFYPAWQFPDPENLPKAGTDWASFRIISRSNKKFAYIQHYPAVGVTPGYDQFQTHEELEVLTSFYGPDADTYASLLRDGLYIAQNREVMTTQNMALISTGDLKTVPSLVKERWLMRIDLMVYLRRQIVRNYPILDVSGVGATVYVDGVETLPIDVTHP